MGKGGALNTEQREKVIDMAAQGLRAPEIARQLELNTNRVAGVITMAKNRGRIPSNQPAQPIHPVENFTMPEPTPTPPPAPTLQPAPATPGFQVPAQSQDGFNFKSSPGAGGFTSPGQQTKYTVERFVPNDGLMGTHYGTFTPDDLGRIYGEGQYRVSRQEPGRPPQGTEQTISSSYGPPKYPKMAGSRPQPFGARPWDRQQDDDPDSPRYSGRHFDPRDRGISEFARHSAPQSGIGEAVAAEAVRQLGDLNRQAMTQTEALRKSGPDTFMTQFFARQQEEWQRQRAEEREREEKRRREEDERVERRQVEEQRRHERDLEKVRLDTESRAKIEQEMRRTLLELEQKKLDLIKEESRAREQLLIGELEKSRVEAKETRERIVAEMAEVKRQSEERIQNVQAAVEEEIERGRETLKREHDLREKYLGREHELKQEMLKLREDTMGRVNGDGISGVMEKIVKEVGATIKEVVELKKLEAISPEAQVAAAVRSADGNVVAADARLDPSAPQSNGGGNGNGNGNGNGGHEAATAPSAPPVPQRPVPGQSLFDAKIVEAVRHPLLQGVLEEWARQIRAGVTPASFAQTYLTWMQDGSDMQTVKGCTTFANYMSTRSWAEMMKVLGPNVPEDTLRTFQTVEAEKFYTTFNTLVIGEMRRWADTVLAEQQAMREASDAREAEADGEPEAADRPEGGREVEARAEARAEAKQLGG